MRKLTDIFMDCLFVPKCAVCRARLQVFGGGLCEDCRRAYDAARAGILRRLRDGGVGLPVYAAEFGGKRLYFLS